MADAPDTPDVQAPEDADPQAQETAPKQDTSKSEPKAKPEGKSQKQEPAKGPAPWEAKLDEALNGDDPRTALDAMMRESQSYTTQQEQRAAVLDKLYGEYEDPMDAAATGAGILSTLIEDPIKGIGSIAAALIDEGKIQPEDLMDSLMETLGVELDDEDALDHEDEDDLPLDDDEDEDPLDEDRQYIQQLREREFEEQANTEWEQFTTKLGDEIPGLDLDRFEKLVVMYEGDIEQAFTDYMQNWHQEPEPAKDLPPDPGSSPAPPEKHEFGSIRDAVNSL